MIRSGANTPTDFWSRRRQAVAAEEQEQRRAKLEASSAQQAAATNDKPNAEILDGLNLPDPEQMQRGDDFTAFMTREVPAHLRRAALRQLWRSDPVLANLDGLVDYGQDFTDAGLEIGKLSTAYQVGKGMTAHVENSVPDTEPPEELEAQEPDWLPETTADSAGITQTQEQVPDPKTISIVEVEEPHFHAPPPRAHRPRRMSFITTQEQA